MENIKVPWYKERLKTKYLKDLRDKQQLSGALDSRRWRFLTPGQDDFRDGYPVALQELFSHCKRGPSPVVFGIPNLESPGKVPLKRLSKDQVCYSKQNPQSQAQRELIQAVEHKLKHHLTFYAHPESGKTSEVLLALDPHQDIKTSPEEHLEEIKAQSDISAQETVNPGISNKVPKKKMKVKAINTFKWKELKESTGDNEDQSPKIKQAQDEKKMIIKHLCDWISALAGESSDLNESTILELFKSDYEKKTCFSTPVYKTIIPAYASGKFSTSIEVQAGKLSREKTASGTLKAPVDFKKDLKCENQLHEQSEELIHGILAFREFIISKGARMPRLLRAIFSEEEGMKIRGSTPSPHKTRGIH